MLVPRSMMDVQGVGGGRPFSQEYRKGKDNAGDAEVQQNTPDRLLELYGPASVRERLSFSQWDEGWWLRAMHRNGIVGHERGVNSK
jgi:hypothetical protein